MSDQNSIMKKDKGKYVNKKDGVDPRVPDVTKSMDFPDDDPQSEPQPRAGSVTVAEEVHIKEEPHDPRVPDETTSMVSRTLCHICDNDPCIASQLEPRLFFWFHTLRNHKTNREIRHTMYCNSVKEIYGPSLGKGVRVRLALCLEKKIRSIAPEKHYVGFKPSYTTFETLYSLYSLII